MAPSFTTIIIQEVFFESDSREKKQKHFMKKHIVKTQIYRQDLFWRFQAFVLWKCFYKKTGWPSLKSKFKVVQAICVHEVPLLLAEKLSAKVVDINENFFFRAFVLLAARDASIFNNNIFSFTEKCCVNFFSKQNSFHDKQTHFFIE